MKAIEYRQYGGVERLQMGEVACPLPKAGEVLVRVRAVSLNPVDWKILRGDFKLLSGRRMPRGIGMDFAGTVEGVGSGVRGVDSGQRVVGVIAPLRAGPGALAEFVCAKRGQIAPLADELSFETAATLPVAGVSALDCLRAGGPRGAGSSVLVIGATGGVGSFCVQLAKLRDLRVTAVCRHENAALARELGADDVVAYDRTDPLKIGKAFDLILDVAAQYSFARCAPLLAAHGTYVTTIPGPRPIWDRLRTALIGTRKARWILAKPTAEPLSELVRFVTAGRLRPLISRTYPFAETRAAYAALMSAHTRGKLVVTLPVA